MNDTSPAEADEGQTISPEATTESERSASEATDGKAAPKKTKTPAQRAAAARKRARRLAKLKPPAEVAEFLYKAFPKAFFAESRARQPLTVGIHLAVIEATEGKLHKLEVQRFLNNYAHSLGYLHAIAERKPRLDLNGEPTEEEITDQMVADARAEIDQIQEKRAARGDKVQRGPAKPGAKGGKPPRGGRKPRAPQMGVSKERGRPVAGSAEEIKQAAMRNQRQAKIIEKKRRVRSPATPTLMAAKLADAGLGSGNTAPRKKLRLGKKSDDSDNSAD